VDKILCVKGRTSPKPFGCFHKHDSATKKYDLLNHYE
jgi:hypothetical protein